ncbi:hypothetical protein [Streptococcus sp. S784/96/1]|uniref:hypothetical protein n=1 Tax=Streptococcus sp. S784/96/1 TaxID=2653499 RepID=UPI001386AB7C|nr:hypothetical protein [Streptococcus sp. S784/96/1]
MDSFNWNGTSCEIDISNSEVLEYLKQESIGEHDEVIKKYIVYSSSDVLFCADSYINHKSYFYDIIDFFEDIDFTHDVRLVTIKGGFPSINVVNYSDEVLKYKSIFENNHIDTDRNISNISINLLKKLNNQTTKVRLLRKIYILLMLSTSIKLDINTFTFKIEQDGSLVETIVDYKKSDDKDIDILDKFYEWILNEKGYENTYNEKLRIVRNLITRNNEFYFSLSMLESAKSIFKRVIKKETDRYFEEVGQLKNDFIAIAERENNTYQSLHLKLLGWLSALGITIFDAIKNYEGLHIFERLLNSNSEKTNLILFLLIFALCAILTMYILEARKNQEEFYRLKTFYTQRLLFTKDDFQNKVSFPEIDRKYLFIITWFLFVLIFRIFWTNFTYIILSLIFTAVEYLMYKLKFIDKICTMIDRKE